MITAVNTADEFRYLLRDGRFINARVVLSAEETLVYQQQDGLLIYGLLSGEAEKHLMQLVKTSSVLKSKGLKTEEVH